MTATDDNRHRAYQLKQQGWRVDEIAQMLNVSPATIRNWLSPNVDLPLTPEQKQELFLLLIKAPGAYDLPGKIWTSSTICTLLQRQWGITLLPIEGQRFLEGLPDFFDSRLTSSQVSTRKRQGKSAEAIANELRLPLPVVQKWFKHSSPRSTQPIPPQSTPRRQKISDDQLRNLAACLEKQPSDYGIAEISWTRAAIAQLIQQTFGVSLQPSQVLRLLRRMKRLQG